MRLLYVDNMAAHYRKSIFCLMDSSFDVEFLFGEPRQGIRQMDTDSLKGIIKITSIRYLFFKTYWQSGIIKKLFGKFDRYLLIGETRALSTWMFCVLARLCGKSKHVYLWSHGFYGKEKWGERLLKKLFFRLPGGGIFLYGNYARDLMIREGFSPNQLFVIHNSLDYERQLELRNQMYYDSIYTDHYHNISKNVIFIGRFTAVKQLDLLLKAQSLCKERGFIFNLTLIGDGQNCDSLKELCRRLCLDNYVWFYGSCYDEEENARLIYNADLCVSPGNVGLTAMHSLVYGTPVLTHSDFSHQMPEFEAIHEGETGDFFMRGSVESLADKIMTWFVIHKDRSVVRQLCYNEIDSFWTPKFQIDILKKNL